MKINSATSAGKMGNFSRSSVYVWALMG